MKLYHIEFDEKGISAARPADENENKIIKTEIREGERVVTSMTVYAYDEEQSKQLAETAVRGLFQFAEL